jgi:hypothetical protein
MSAANQRPRPHRSSDRRKWIRHSPAPSTACRLILDGTIALWALQIPDVSVGGICLVLDVLLPHGSTLMLELQNPAGRVSCRRQARLASIENGPGAYFTTRWVFSHDLSYTEADRLL